MSEFITVTMHNALRFHHRLMAKYLRRRGWVAFYLDEVSRTCNGDTCWMKLYQSSDMVSNDKPSRNLTQSEPDRATAAQNDEV
jgi:hypothetical protein